MSNRMWVFCVRGAAVAGVDVVGREMRDVISRMITAFIDGWTWRSCRM